MVCKSELGSLAVEPKNQGAGRRKKRESNYKSRTSIERRNTRNSLGCGGK